MPFGDTVCDTKLNPFPMDNIQPCIRIHRQILLYYIPTYSCIWLLLALHYPPIVPCLPVPVNTTSVIDGCRMIVFDTRKFANCYQKRLHIELYNNSSQERFTFTRLWWWCLIHPMVRSQSKEGLLNGICILWTCLVKTLITARFGMTVIMRLTVNDGDGDEDITPFPGLFNNNAE